MQSDQTQKVTQMIDNFFWIGKIIDIYQKKVDSIIRANSKNNEKKRESHQPSHKRTLKNVVVFHKLFVNEQRFVMEVYEVKKPLQKQALWLSID